MSIVCCHSLECIALAAYYNIEWLGSRSDCNIRNSAKSDIVTTLQEITEDHHRSTDYCGLGKIHEGVFKQEQGVISGPAKRQGVTKKYRVPHSVNKA